MNGSRAEWVDGLAVVDPRGLTPGVPLPVLPEATLVENRLHLDPTVSGGRAVPAATREPA